MGTSYGTIPQISLPSSVYELRDYIKRRLGYPVVQINVSANKELLKRVEELESKIK